MDVIYPRCAGLDVHKSSIAACRRIIGPDGKLRSSVRTFGTTTHELVTLAEWLSDGVVTHVAMESTGVYWKPVWNILQDRFTVLLVNAQHLKRVPGHKTDVSDSEWIAQCLQFGLLSASFVPPQAIRELRDLTRHRTKLLDQRTAVANRIHKLLEDANIKLGDVASDILGVSCQEMLEAIVAGEDDAIKLAEMARKRLRGKIPELRLALEGRVTEHHRFVLGILLEELKSVDSFINRLDLRIEDVIRPFQEQVDILDTAPGIDQRGAQNLIAEIGVDMGQFKSAKHLASWAAMCPGNNESAGKHKSGKTRKGNVWLRRSLGMVSQGAAHTKDTYTQALYRRLVARRGKKRALVAVGHSVLVAVYHMLKGRVRYEDLGSDHFDKLNPDQLTRYLVKRLERLGHKVTIEPAA